MSNSKSNDFSLSESDKLKSLLKNPEDDFQEIVSLLEKKVEESSKQIIELNEKYHSLIDGLTHVGIGIDIVSKDYDVLFQNQVLKERFGDCRGKNCYRSYMNLEKPCEFCPMEDALKYNRVERTELIAADERSYELISAPFPNRDGTIDKVAEVVIDITEHKQAEVKLRESEEKYKNLSNELETIIDLIPGWLFCKDKNDIVTHINQNFADSLNLEKEQIIGKSSFELFPEEQAEAFRKDDLEVISSGKPLLNIEESADFPDGKVWAITNKAPYYNEKGDTMGIIGLSIDITERKKIEQKLKESEEKFRTIAEQSLIGIGIMQDDLIKYVNKKFGEIFGFTSEEMLKWPPHDFIKTVHPEDRDFILEQARRKQKGSDDYLKNYQFRGIKKSGEVIWIENFTKSIMYEGRPASFVALIDITERKNAGVKLTEAEKFLSNIFTSIQDGICVLDKDFNIISVNPKIEEWYAHSKPIIGNKCFKIFRNRLEPCEDCECKNVIKSGDPFCESELYKELNGKIDQIFDVYSFPLYDQETGDIDGIIKYMRDITKQKKAEDAFLEERKFTETALNAQRDTFFVFEPSTGKAIRWNKAFSEISGYSDREISSLKAPESYYSKKDLESISESDKLIIKEGTAINELTLITKERKLIPFEYAASGIFDDDNKLKYIVAIGRDITERKHVEEILYNERDLIRTLLENHPDFIYFKDSEARFQHISKRFSEFFGRNLEDIIGKTDLELFPEEIAKQTHSEDIHVIKTGIPLINKEENTAGTWVLTTKIPWIDNEGNIKGLFGISRDITERKKAEQKLKESEEKYRGLINNITDIIFELNINGKCTYVSNQLFEISGFHPEEMIGQNIFQYLHPEDLLNVTEKVKESFQKGIRISTDFRLQHKDGYYVPISSNFNVIRINGEQRFIGVLRDNTEKKQAEIKLKESEEKFRTLAEQSFLGIAILQNNIVRYVNKQLAHIFGYTVEEIMNWGVGGFINVIYHEDKKIVAEQAEKKQSGEPDAVNQYQFRGIKKNGDMIWLEVFSKTINYGGKLADFATIHDITDEKISEQKLKESEEKYRVLFDNSPIGIGLSTLGGKAIDSNDAMEELTGYSIEDLNKIGISSIYVNRNARSEMLKLLQEVGKVDDYEIKLRKKDNTEFFGSLSFDIIDLGGKKIIQSSLRDITERKKAEEKIKESEEHFRNIAEQSFMGIEIIQDGKIKYVNDAASKILEFSIQEMKAWENEDLFKFVYPEDLPMIYEQQKKRQEEKLPHIRYSIRAITKSGKIKWLEISSKIVLYQGKEAIFAIFYDVSERKEAEQELIKLNQMKSELLRRTSHELKTPLVSIKGFSELLLQVHRDKLDALVISTLNEIKQGCLRLETLIGDILKTAELESGTIQLHKSEEDLSFLVRVCVNEIKGFSKLRNHTINLELHDNLITQFEKEQIHQVIGNLLNNAVKYTPSSGLIEIKSDIRDGFIILSIKDNGIGFTEEEKTRIFKQFGKIERYGQGLDIIAEGSGFGLFISKKIIELHGGDIWVESEGRNMGSLFYISLPLI